MKIAVIGLGYVGLPLSALLAEKLEVIGFDLDISRIEKLKAREPVLAEPGLQEILDKVLDNRGLTFATNPEDISDCNVKIITVNTPYEETAKDVDYSFLDSALQIVCSHINRGNVVVLKSTVPVGTTSQRVIKALNSEGYRVPEDIGVVFSPERIAEGQAIYDYRTLPKIIGASDDRSFALYSEIVTTAIGGKIIRVSNPETAEMVKMTDNYARLVFLGLTNELALICEKVGVDVMEVLRASKDGYSRNAGLLIPGPGVGGSCLNKDPFILKSDLAKKGLSLKMVDAAQEVNCNMPAHVCEMVKELKRNANTIAIAGVAFKRDTDDIRFAPSLTLKHLLEINGATVKLSDPFVTCVNGIIGDVYKAVEATDVLIIVTDHKQYINIDLKRIKSAMNVNPLIIDTRALIQRDEVKRLGFEYRGLGRLQ